MENKTSSPQETSSLMPCPFCGKKARIENINEFPSVYSVDCPDAYCATFKHGNSIKDAIAEWNTRPREQALLSALAKAKSALEEIQDLEKGLIHPPKCLQHETNDEACDCGKGMIEVLTREALTAIAALEEK